MNREEALFSSSFFFFFFFLQLLCHLASLLRKGEPWLGRGGSRRGLAVRPRQGGEGAGEEVPPPVQRAIIPSYAGVHV